ncbi:unnamed protein product, partial [Meganyctiphanes norvegica]
MGGELYAPTDITDCQALSMDRQFPHKQSRVKLQSLYESHLISKCVVSDILQMFKRLIIKGKMNQYGFSSTAVLYIMRHERHITEYYKILECECGKSFSTSGNYNTHKRIHSGEKPYACDLCDYRCSQSGRLLKHKRMHSGEKPFQCPNCGKSFANAESVKIHMRIHTGERPFKCGNCGK